MRFLLYRTQSAAIFVDDNHIDYSIILAYYFRLEKGAFFPKLGRAVHVVIRMREKTNKGFYPDRLASLAMCDKMNLKKEGETSTWK